MRKKDREKNQMLKRRKRDRLRKKGAGADKDRVTKLWKSRQCAELRNCFAAMLQRLSTCHRLSSVVIGCHRLSSVVIGSLYLRRHKVKGVMREEEKKRGSGRTGKRGKEVEMGYNKLKTK